MRTFLIHKNGPKSDPSNWRPITIGSTLQRLLHRILARIRNSIEVHLHGTLCNSITLDNYISSLAKAGKSYSVVALDVSKAFDSVAHSSLRKADEDTLEYLRHLPDNNHHLFKNGVRQNDPLNPIILIRTHRLNTWATILTAGKFTN